MGDSFSANREDTVRIPAQVPSNEGRDEEAVKCFHGGTFTQLVRNNTPYGNLFETLTSYEVYINTQGPHWYLMVRLESSSLPFFTLEIVTTNGRTCKAMTCVIHQTNVTEKACASQNTTLEKICSIADRIMSQMGKYDPLNYNGQQFCNAVLRSFGADAFPTSIGPNLPNNGLEEDLPVNNDSITEYNTDFDNLDVVMNSVQERVNN